MLRESNTGPSRIGLLVECVGLCTLLLTGCDCGTATEAELDPVIDLITLVSGDSQFGRTGEALADPVVVRVADRGGDPVAAFDAAFHTHIGITVDVFESSLYSRLASYLNR